MDKLTKETKKIYKQLISKKNKHKHEEILNELKTEYFKTNFEFKRDHFIH